MLKKISVPGVLLFGTIPLRFAIEWMPFVGFPKISTALAYFVFILLIWCLCLYVFGKYKYEHSITEKWLLAIYVIYSCYIVYDVFVSPQIPRLNMAHVPTSNMSLFQSMFSLGIVMYLAPMFNNKVNYVLWAKCSCVFLTIMLIVYSLKVDLSIYVLSHISVGETEDNLLSDYGAIDGLRLGWFCGINFVCNLFLITKWTRNKILSKVIFVAISLFTLSVCVATIQRGPILFILSTTVFYVYSKGKIRGKCLLLTVSVLLCLFLFSDVVFGYLNAVLPELVGRFGDTLSSGASGRFGSEDSAYNLAFKEFFMSPIFGHYFRYSTVSGYFYGLYPHNIILESLMTMGVLFCIPFFFILLEAVKKSYFAIKNDSPIAIAGLLFIFVFSTLQTSATMLFASNFWIPLAIICSYKQKTKIYE